jgi:hypothetical protein
VRRLLFVITLAAVAAAPLSGQIAWDSPPLIGPASPLGFAAFLTSLSPGDGIGGLATWRHETGSLELGYRVAVVEGADSDFALGGGVDISGVLSAGIEEADIQVLWWSGLGAGVGEDVLVSIPVGLVAGWTGSGDDVVFSPYVGGHVALDFTNIDGDEISFDALLDLGLDLFLVSGWVIRFGASLGGREALALGLRLPGGA